MRLLKLLILAPPFDFFSAGAMTGTLNIERTLTATLTVNGEL